MGLALPPSEEGVQIDRSSLRVLICPRWRTDASTKVPPTFFGGGGRGIECLLFAVLSTSLSE